MIFLVYDDVVWILNDAYSEIVELGNFLGGYRELFVEYRNEVY